MSLVARLYLLVALAVLPAIVIQIHNELTMRQQREAQVHDEALRLAEFAASDLKGVLAGAHTLLVSLASAPAIRNHAPAACDSLLAELGAHLPQYAALGAADRDGNWFCSWGGNPPWTDDAVGNAPLPAAGAEPGMHIGTLARSLAAGRMILPITLAFADGSGEFAGRVGVGLDLARLQAQYSTRALPPQASFTITDRDGTLLVQVPDVERVGQRIRDSSRWIVNAVQPGTSTGLGLDGVDRVVGFVPPLAMADGGLAVMVGLSAQAALAGMADAQRRGMLLVALGLVLALLAARVAGRMFILKPISVLLRAADRWRDGDLAARVGISSQRSEFGRLGVALDGMAASFAAHQGELNRAIAALQSSEARFRQFAENSHDLLWIFDRSAARIDYLSPAFAEIWGFGVESVLAGERDLLATMHPSDRERAAAALAAILAGEQTTVTYRIRRPDGELRWVRDSGFPIRDASGAVIRAGGICRDITVWKAIERERERSLAERELMLREINHRVKNNLQVVTSLLRLQASRGRSQDIRDAFEEACGRVSTITELHSSMFHGAQVGTLDFGTYLHELCGRLQSALADGRPGGLQIRVEAELGPVDLDRAVPLGLIVNELVTNAIKHGSSGDRGGSVEVWFDRLDGQYRLSVRDEGPGLTADGQVILQQGLGVQLIAGLVRRIQGSLRTGEGPGFEATVEFPVDPPRAKPKPATPVKGKA